MSNATKTGNEVTLVADNGAEVTININTAVAIITRFNNVMN